MKKLFQRKKPIDIEIIGSVKLPLKPGQNKSTEDSGDSSVRIVSKTPLTEEQLRDAVNLLTNELVEQTTPGYIKRAREYRDRGDLDLAVITLRQAIRELLDDQ